MFQSRYLQIADAIIDLQERGFEVDFILSGDRLFCPQHGFMIPAHEYEIVEMHYFPSSPQCSCERMVYGIAVASCMIDGILMTGSENSTAFPDAILEKLNRRSRLSPISARRKPILI